MKLSKNVISLLTILSLVLLTIGAVSAADTNDTGLDDVISDIADINTTTPEISPNNHSSDSDEISEITINNPSNVDENNNINEFFEVKHTPKLLSSNTQKAQISNNILTTSSESQNNNFPESVETISMETPSIDELNSPIFELNTLQTNQLSISTNLLQNTIASINDITIIVDDISGTPNENIKIPVQVYKNNIPVTTGNVIINLNDQIFDSEVIGGVANVDVTLPDNVGTYPTFVVYFDDQSYTIETTTTVKGNDTPGHNIVIFASDVSGNLGDNVVVPVYVYDNNILVNTGTVTVSLDGKKYSSSIVNGVANVDVTLPSNAGTYNTVISYISNDIFENKSITTTVNKNETPQNQTDNIIIQTLDSVIGEPNTIVTIPVSIYNNTTPVNSGIVIITVDGVDYSSEVVEGVANIDILLPNTTGEYDSFVIYTDDNIVESNLLTINVIGNTTPRNISIIPSTISGKPNEKVNIPVYIFDNNVPVQNGTVTITINGKSYVAEVVGGVANVDVTLPDNVGTYPTFVVYFDDQSYTIETTTTVKGNDTPGHNIVIFASDVSGNLGDNVVVPVYVYDNNILVNTGTVTVSLDGKKYSSSIVNGVANVDVTLPSNAGTYNTVISYISNDIFENKSITTTVNKITPQININTQDISEGDNETIIVQLPEDATGNVTIKINNEYYMAYLENGKAKFIIPNLKAGKYIVDAVYSGDNKYLPATITGIINVISEGNTTTNSSSNSTTLNNENENIGLAQYPTGNPILILLISLLSIGISVTKFKK